MYMTNTGYVRLKELLRDKGLSQTEAASLCGLSISGFQSRISGRSTWTVQEMAILSNALELTGWETWEYFVVNRALTMAEMLRIFPERRKEKPQERKSLTDAEIGAAVKVAMQTLAAMKGDKSA